MPFRFASRLAAHLRRPAIRRVVVGAVVGVALLGGSACVLPERFSGLEGFAGTYYLIKVDTFGLPATFHSTFVRNDTTYSETIKLEGGTITLKADSTYEAAYFVTYTGPDTTGELVWTGAGSFSRAGTKVVYFTGSGTETNIPLLPNGEIGDGYVARGIQLAADGDYDTRDWVRLLFHK